MRSFHITIAVALLLSLCAALTAAPGTAFAARDDLNHSSARFGGSVYEGVVAGVSGVDAGAALVPDSPAATKAEQSSNGGNAFLRALAAPFRALARLFGGGGKSSKTARAVTQPTPNVSTAPAAPAETSLPTVAATASSTLTPTNKAARAVNHRKTVNPAATMNPSALHADAHPRTNAVNSTNAGAEAATPGRFTPTIADAALDPLAQGQALLERGSFNEAVAVLSVAAAVGPDLLRANNLLGLAYDRQGLHELAQACYQRALAIAPGDAATTNNLGYSFYLNHQYADAARLLKSAAHRDPSNPRIQNNLAVVSGRLGNYGDAFKYFKRAGGELYARLSLAALYEAAGRDKDAIKNYEAALRLDPVDSGQALQRLIPLYVRTAQPAKAEDARRWLKPSADKTTASS